MEPTIGTLIHNFARDALELKRMEEYNLFKVEKSGDEVVERLLKGVDLSRMIFPKADRRKIEYSFSLLKRHTKGREKKKK